MHFPEVEVTRQKIGELVGAGDDTLNFWIRSGLLRASGGGEGKGRHRKFNLFQINIAAVLVELRHFGVNVSTLGVLAGMLQRGTELALSAPCNFFGVDDAIRLAGALWHLRSGGSVTVANEAPLRQPALHRRGAELDAYYASCFRSARDEADVIDHMRADRDFHDAFEPVLEFALRIGAEDLTPLQLFVDLNHQAFRYVWDDHLSDWGDTEWVVASSEKGGLQVFRAPEGHDLLGQASGMIRSGIFLAPATIFRSVWKDRLQPLLIHEQPPSEEEKKRREATRERFEELQRRKVGR